MVYRTSADPSAGQLGAPPEEGPLLTLNASGRRGTDGMDGARGSDGSGYGAGGTSGGDAGPASPGEHGGHIAIALEGDDAREAALRIMGEIATGASGRQSVDTELTIDDRARHIDLTSCGGRGGDGGQGGNGGHGGRGRDGSDATRYSSGSDGGPGGDGGDGGNGSNGERGGQGGTIRVRVSERDTPFLMLVRENVRGGGGGRAGSNGYGGAAGSGGRGGSSYSWTETDRLAARLTSRVTETDIDTLPLELRVMDSERHEALVKKERRRIKRAQAEQTTAAETRRELLRTDLTSSDEWLPASASSLSEPRSRAT